MNAHVSTATATAVDPAIVAAAIADPASGNPYYLATVGLSEPASSSPMPMMMTPAMPETTHNGSSGNSYLDQTLGMSRGPEGVTLMPSPDLQSSPGYLHFSIPTTVAEEAAWWALDYEHAVPASVTVSLMRPATLEGGPLTGKGYAERKGQTILTSRGETWQGDKLIATAVITFVAFEKRIAS